MKKDTLKRLKDELDIIFKRDDSITNIVAGAVIIRSLLGITIKNETSLGEIMSKIYETEWGKTYVRKSKKGSLVWNNDGYKTHYGISKVQKGEIQNVARYKYMIQGQLEDDFVNDNNIKVEFNVNAYRNFNEYINNIIHMETNGIVETGLYDMSYRYGGIVSGYNSIITSITYTVTDILEHNLRDLLWELTLDGSDIEYDSTHCMVGDAFDVNVENVEICDSVVMFNGIFGLDITKQYGSRGDVRRDDGMLLYGTGTASCKFNIHISHFNNNTVEINNVNMLTDTIYVDCKNEEEEHE